jgi:hypothetical protein
VPKRRQHPFGAQFDEKRTKEGRGDINVLLENNVNLSNVAGSSHFDDLIELGRSAKPPLKIKHLSPNLKEPQFPRGRGYFGSLIGQIQKILLNHPELRWWMESDGLVVNELPPDLDFVAS